MSNIFPEDSNENAASGHLEASSEAILSFIFPSVRASLHLRYIVAPETSFSESCERMNCCMPTMDVTCSAKSLTAPSSAATLSVFCSRERGAFQSTLTRVSEYEISGSFVLSMNAKHRNIPTTENPNIAHPAHLCLNSHVRIFSYNFMKPWSEKRDSKGFGLKAGSFLYHVQ